MLVSGVSLTAFWLSNFIFDLMKYILPCACGPIFCYLFNINGLVVDVLYVTAILFILYGFAGIPFAYLTSFLFKDPGNAQVIVFFLNVVLGAILPVIFLVLKLFGSTQISNIA
jgi:ATP-binding cassette subfamily A (ABC1) protein 3